MEKDLRGIFWISNNFVLFIIWFINTTIFSLNSNSDDVKSSEQYLC